MEFRLDTLLENEIIDSGKITEIVCEGNSIWKGLSDDVETFEKKYNFIKFDNNIQEQFNKPTYRIIVEEKCKNCNKEHDFEYGVPEEKKFPLDTKEHVLSAIKFFSYVKPEYEEHLAHAIKAKMTQYGISSDHVGEDNKLAKYVKANISEGKTYYHTCPKCGANLDPGEKCDCEKEKEEKAPKTKETKDKKQIKGQLELDIK